MARTKEKTGRVLLRRLAWGVGAVALFYFTVEGGEYSMRDLWSQKGRKARLESDVAQLKRDVDSLRLELKSIRTDNARLERIARENFGMVRGDKEILYLVGAEASSARDSAR